MSWILTLSGLRFDFSDPQPDQVCLQDIAHALSQIQRFGGHSERPCNVAAHSLQVLRLARLWQPSDLDPREVAGWAILHDAPEAYTGDVVDPLKRLLRDFQRYEDKVEDVVLRHFDLTITEPVWEFVKQCDLAAFLSEVRDIRRRPLSDFGLEKYQDLLDRTPKGLYYRNSAKACAKAYTAEVCNILESR